MTAQELVDLPDDGVVYELSRGMLIQVMLKVRDYLESGTPLVWVLDPRSQLTAVFRPGAPVRFVEIDGALDGEDVLPGFSLPLRDVLR